MQTLILNQKGSDHYLIFIYRFFLAVFAGHLIVTGGEFQSFTELIKLSGYPVAMLSSVLIAVIAIEQVNFCVQLVNSRFPTYDSKHVKLFWQIIICVVVPFLTIFTMATIYYAALGHFILDTMWPANHAWHIVLMLIVLNIIFRMAQREALPVPIAAVPIVLVVPAERIITHVIHEKGINRIFYDNGSQELDRRSLFAINESLDPLLYILNPRDSIIRCDNIKDGRHTVEGKADIELISPAGKIVTVSKNQKKLYLKYFKSVPSKI